MKFLVRLYPLGSRSQGLLDVLLKTGVPRIVSARWPVAIEHSALPELLQQGDSTEGFWISGETLFTQKERREVSHYEVVCRKYVKESDADHDANEAARDQAPRMNRENVSSIRLAKGFTLSRINLKPNMVGAIGDWTEEYVAGSGVGQAFESSGFTGFSLLPIFQANN